MPRAARTFVEHQPTGNVLGPEHPLALKAAAKLLLAQKRAMAAYGPTGDPWAFVRDCVWTLDEASSAARRYPDVPYGPLLAERWREHRLLAVPKSRRMTVTWLFVALNYWLARFQPYSKIAFMARKLGKTESEGSAELVRRAKFIHEHLPPVFPPCEIDYAIGICRFPNGSEIIGLGEGPEQARQHTFTSVMADELGHWQEAAETWIALKPTIQGGGRIVAISSAYPGFFCQLVHDTLR